MKIHDDCVQELKFSAEDGQLIADYVNLLARAELVD
jgi:hypothetical protein